MGGRREGGGRSCLQSTIRPTDSHLTLPYLRYHFFHFDNDHHLEQLHHRLPAPDCQFKGCAPQCIDPSTTKMAPSDPAAAGRDRKIRTIIDFAGDLLAQLPVSLDSSSAETLLADVNHHIHTVNALPQKNASLSSQNVKILKDCGRKLWNECIKEKRRIDHTPMSEARSRLFVRIRVFAFLVHALARENHGKRNRDTAEDVVYLLNLALTVGRVCIEGSDLDGARLGLHKVADYVERLKAMNGESREGADVTTKFEAEYLTMRTALAWKEARLDVAEHMYTKAESLRHHLEPPSAEHLADTLQHIGSDLFSKSDHSMALKWLRRAYELINGQELERLSRQGLDLRLEICHDLVQVLLATGSPEHIQEADDLVAYLESEIGDKPVVLHWKLEILQKSPKEAFDTDACASILRRMIRSIDFSDAVLGFLLQNIKELRDRNSELATGLLDELLLSRLLSLGNSEWIGKTVVRRVWVSTMETESSTSANHIMTLFERIPLESGSLLNADVTAAAQSLIWKKIEPLYTKKQYNAAILWCQVALHPVFANCGDANKGKFGRKLIMCAISSGDTDTAKSTFQTMPLVVQDDPLTRYLMFKVSLACWDHELGSDCIQHLSRCSDKETSQDILYACVKEAQQVGDKLCTLTALKAVVEKCDSDATPKAHFPTILRCTIRLIHMIENQDQEEPNIGPGLVEDTCHVFEKAAKYARLGARDTDGNKLFTFSELEWFRKNAYNIGLTKCHVWELCNLVRIFTSCLNFVECYPRDTPATDMYDIQLMKMRCHFIVSAALVSQARTEYEVEEQLQRYTEVRHHAADFDKTFEKAFEKEPGSKEEQAFWDMAAKAATLFVFDFEGAVCLRGWDELGQIVRKAKPCKDEMMYKAMGDCLLRSHAPGKVLYATLRLIINEIFELEDFDIQKLAKYLRCMFQAILPLDDSLALQVIDQALQIAREGGQVERPFPADELDWVVTTTFNHAIDILARGDEALCQRWALKALDLAEQMNDNGYMREVLRERVVKLGLGKGE